MAVEICISDGCFNPPHYGYGGYCGACYRQKRNAEMANVRTCWCGVVIPKTRTFCIEHGGIRPKLDSEPYPITVAHVIAAGPTRIVDKRPQYVEYVDMVLDVIASGPTFIKPKMGKAIFPGKVCEVCGVEIDNPKPNGKPQTCSSMCRVRKHRGFVFKPEIIPIPPQPRPCANPECSVMIPADAHIGRQFCTKECWNSYRLNNDEYQAAARERGLRYRQENPEKVREAQHRRRAAELNASFPELPVLMPDPTECAYCGSTENLELEHIIPLARNGAHSPKNCLWACKECNRGVGGKFKKLLSEWRPELAEKFPGQTVEDAMIEATMIRERRRFAAYESGELLAIPDGDRLIWAS